ncbi:type II toxin-antitoxin system HicA family toxin [Nitrosococcus wardiae]|uniref:Type II toxin-antitoxin system HicA family toxin n=1 Tax=Nitrosococcus wardiae TaxID=1814290 RepID=A0A4P7BXF4_9GAMM|nr:type II toxin-antitoxin system HicA family toxin [Nitrosococcus wardiae]QBQ53122.1 type II toxin-antitoxin system HicA family toxin [Nitrosococcus wardiae]
MPVFGPIKRRELIYYLRQFGFEGPYSGGRHQFMIRGSVTIRIPNPHQGDIGKELLARILRQAQISKEEWKKL